MKVALATHSLCGYPIRLGQVPAPEKRRALFSWAKRHGFAGIEVGDWWLDFFTAPIEEVVALKAELASYDLELAGLNCLRKCVTHPAVSERNRRDLRRAIEVAGAVAPMTLSISLSLAPEASGTPPDRVRGLDVSPGGSAGAADGEFAEAAAFLAELADIGARTAVSVAIELHHCSLADNSRSMLRLLELAGHPNLSANPDLGNLHWGYAEPEEPWHDAIEKLAGRVTFWHVKNVQRTFIPELRHSFFNHAALDAGDIDYRWALAHLVAAGFDGYLSIEGAGRGDFLAFAARGKAYLDELFDVLASGDGLAVQ